MVLAAIGVASGRGWRDARVRTALVIGGVGLAFSFGTSAGIGSDSDTVVAMAVVAAATALVAGAVLLGLAARVRGGRAVAPA